MDSTMAWILGHTSGDFITPALLQRIAGDFFKPMNRAVARENLKLFKRIMDESHTEFMLIFGTLLGAVREGDFIEHDYDTDVMIMEESRAGLAHAAPRLLQSGFEFVRCKNHGRFVTFMRKGEFIDVYVAENDHRFPWRACWNVDGSLLPRALLNDFTDFSFLQETFRVPSRYEEIFVILYGKDWRVSRKNCSAYIPFDVFHPYRSTVILIRKYLPRGVARWLKRLIRKA